ncbi:MAG: hypothetical protein AAB367_01205 [Patescibacteria group bacterium]
MTRDTITQLNKYVPWKSLVATVAGVFTLSAFVTLAAWSDPTAPPIGGNPDAPVHVGSTPQSKAGNLSVGGIFSSAADLLVDGADPSTTGDRDVALWLMELGTTRNALNPYKWKVRTADDVGTDVQPNAFEVWEYPDSVTAPGTSDRARLKILKSVANLNPYPIEIDAAGGLTLKGGKLSVYDPASSSNGQLEYINTAGNIGLHVTSGNVRSLYLNWARGQGGVRVGNGANAPGTLYARDVILKAYDGSSCYKVEVNNAGVLRTTLATC